jgi:hypothetical protein
MIPTFTINNNNNTVDIRVEEEGVVLVVVRGEEDIEGGDGFLVLVALDVVDVDAGEEGVPIGVEVDAVSSLTK